MTQVSSQPESMLDRDLSDLAMVAEQVSELRDFLAEILFSLRGQTRPFLAAEIVATRAEGNLLTAGIELRTLRALHMVPEADRQ